MKAIFLNLSAWMILPVMDAIAKYLSTSLNVLQIAWARYFFTVIFLLPLIFFFYREMLVPSKNTKLQIVTP